MFDSPEDEIKSRGQKSEYRSQNKRKSGESGSPPYPS
jgi:hypothetical protein